MNTAMYWICLAILMAAYMWTGDVHVPMRMLMIGTVLMVLAFGFGTIWRWFNPSSKGDKTTLPPKT